MHLARASSPLDHRDQMAACAQEHIRRNVRLAIKIYLVITCRAKLRDATRVASLLYKGWWSRRDDNQALAEVAVKSLGYTRRLNQRLEPSCRHVRCCVWSKV